MMIGMSKEEAMRQYVQLIAAGDANWESNEVLKSFSA